VIEEFAWNFIIILFGFMPGLGLLLYQVKDRRIVFLTACVTAVMGIFCFIFLESYGRNLFAFYSATYIFSAVKLRSVGAGFLVSSATVSFWEIPAQVYRYLGWWDVKQFSGWLWIIYGVAMVYALLFISKTEIRKAVIPLLSSTAVNTMILITYPTLIPYADNVWYLCRVSTALTLTYLVLKHGQNR
jgi:hypothetical protein